MPPPEPDLEQMHFHVENMKAVIGCTCDPAVWYMIDGRTHMLYLEHEDSCQYLRQINAPWN